MRLSSYLLIFTVCLTSGFAFAVGGDLGTATYGIPGKPDGSTDYPYLIEDFADFQVLCSDSVYWAQGVHVRLETDIDLDPALPDRQIYTQAPIAPDTDSSNGSTFDGTAFMGYFNGNNHIISNLTINGAFYCGLFGKTKGKMVIIDLGIENADVTGSEGYIGALVGYIDKGDGYSAGDLSHCYSTGVVNGSDGSKCLGGLLGCNNSYVSISNCFSSVTVTSGNDSGWLGGLLGYSKSGISNCYSTGKVTGGDFSDYIGGLAGDINSNLSNCYSTGEVIGGFFSSNIGGLVGRNSNYTISNCYSTGAVTGGDNSENLGGLAGYNWFGNIRNCYSTSSVTGGNSTKFLGGLVGYVYDGTISNCYTTGWVTGGDNSGFLGGLTGYNTNYEGVISNCYSIGIITAGIDSGHLGGLAGFNSTDFTIRNCYWDAEASNFATSAGGVSKTTAEMKNIITFIGWIDGSWTIDDGNDYPKLAWQNASGIPLDTDYPSASYSGTGSPTDPFVLTSPADLVCMSRRTPDWDKDFVLSNDIDMAGVVYIPVVKFTGSFDGKGYTIQNLTIDCEVIGTSSHLGLFGQAYRYDISNLGLENVNIIGADYSYYLGALVGYFENGDITYCYSTGSLTGGHGSNSLGGLVGRNEGDINNCYSAVTVTSGENSSDHGGLVGHNIWYGDINKCFSTGDVTSGNYSYYLGGLVGYSSLANINNCYSTGNVSGGYDSSSLGGLAGNNQANISNCYSTGAVARSEESRYVGGFVGYNYAGEGNCFWDVQSSGIGFFGANNFGAMGKTTAQMQMLHTFTDVGWDFSTTEADETVWYMPGNDYPKLQWNMKIANTEPIEVTLFVGEHDTIQTGIFSPTNETTCNWTISGQEECSWIKGVSPDSGSSTGPTDITTVEITIDSIGLDVGKYTYLLTLEDQDGNRVSMPVYLQIYNQVDLEEFALLAQYWFMAGCDESQSCFIADWYADGVINELDLMQIAQSWLGYEMLIGSNWIDYLEDFGDGQPVENWNYNTTNSGRIQVVNGRLRMDSSTNGIDSLNEAILHINLEGQSGLMLSFWQGESDDEPTALPPTFSGSWIGDGVAVSSDGINWATVVNVFSLDVGTNGQTFNVDLDAFAVEYTTDFQIKFQQYDDWTWDSDGREWDNIRVYKVE